VTAEPHEHEFVMLSCLADGDGRSTIRGRCTVCEEVHEFRGCTMTGIDYGEDSEGIVTQDVSFVEVLDA